VRPALRALVAAAVALPLVLAGPAASAQTAGCPPDPDFHYTNVKASHIAALYHQGDPGETLNLSLIVGVTVTATATGTVSGGLTAIVAGARVDVSASLAVSLAVSATASSTWTVPTTVHQGYLAMGAVSQSMSWTHGSYTLACRWVVDGAGTLNAPYHLPASWHWTT
jgi:hypothetical protein